MARKAEKSPDLAQLAQNLFAEFSNRRPMRAGSLVVSVFGDAIAPHGGSVWLGSLIEAMKPFGVTQRLVRTSVFRLAKDEWLTSEQVGRRSYYRLTGLGRRRFTNASERIYSEPRRDWPGTWCLLLLAGAEAGHREELRRELAWLGFGAFSANVMAHPAPNIAEVEDRLNAIEGSEHTLMLEAKVSPFRQAYLHDLVDKSWNIAELGQRYQSFLDRFRPLYTAARRERAIDPALAFALRIFLLHEYRRILLRDPLLPDELLPSGWGQVPAYQLCRNIYGLLLTQAEAYLTEHMETADGPLPPAEPAFYQRFGGLPERKLAALS